MIRNTLAFVLQVVRISTVEPRLNSVSWLVTKIHTITEQVGDGGYRATWVKGQIQTHVMHVICFGPSHHTVPLRLIVSSQLPPLHPSGA